MLQQAYVDLPYIDYRSAYTIGLSFYRIFDRVDVGGLTTSTEPRTLGLCFLDNPIDEEGNAHMLDFIASTAGILPQSAEDTYLLTLEETTVQEYLSQHTIRDILRDALTADNEYAVMMYEIFTNWTDYEISDFLHLSKWDTVEKIRNRAGRTLAGQYHKILDKLREINSPYYDRFWASLPRQEENKRAAMCAFSFRRSNVGTAAAVTVLRTGVAQLRCRSLLHSAVAKRRCGTTITTGVAQLRCVAWLHKASKRMDKNTNTTAQRN